MEKKDKKISPWEVIEYGLKGMARERGISIEEAAAIARQIAEENDPDYIKHINRAVEHIQEEQSED